MKLVWRTAVAGNDCVRRERQSEFSCWRLSARVKASRISREDRCSCSAVCGACNDDSCYRGSCTASKRGGGLG